MPSAVFTHILNRIVYPTDETLSLKDIIIEARDTVAEMFKDDKHIDELTNIINRAMELSDNGADDLENIKMLGQGMGGRRNTCYCNIL